RQALLKKSLITVSPCRELSFITLRQLLQVSYNSENFKIKPKPLPIRLKLKSENKYSKKGAKKTLEMLLSTHRDPGIPFQILLQGDVGTGKTTLVKDFASQFYKKTDAYSYSIIVYLPLLSLFADYQLNEIKTVLQNNILTSLLEQLFCKHIDKLVEQQCIKPEKFSHFFDITSAPIKLNEAVLVKALRTVQMEKKLLLILDGLDEIYDHCSSEYFETVLHFIKKLTQNEFSCIITSRPYAFDKQNINVKSGRYQVYGWSSDEQKIYLEQIGFEESKKEYLLTLFRHSPWKEIGRIPFLLYLFTQHLITTQDWGVHLAQYAIQVYQILTEKLYQRAYQKKNEHRQLDTEYEKWRDNLEKILGQSAWSQKEIETTDYVSSHYVNAVEVPTDRERRDIRSLGISEWNQPYFRLSFDILVDYFAS
ncbi:MAG: NACHT domain-containing protein, partial [Gammaproteobacteria bacterium]